MEIASLELEYKQIYAPLKNRIKVIKHLKAAVEYTPLLIITKNNYYWE